MPRLFMQMTNFGGYDSAVGSGSILRFVWVVFITGIIIGTIANLNTTTTDTPLSQLNIIHLLLAFPIQVVFVVVVLIMLTLLSQIGSREPDATLPRALSEQDRIHMLRRFRLRYEQMLTQSLGRSCQVEMGLVSRPAAVQNAVNLALRLPDQPEQSLPLNTSIIEAYELAQQELLILGEPGAGKSTLLLELAHYLVQQAEQNVYTAVAHSATTLFLAHETLFLARLAC